MAHVVQPFDFLHREYAVVDADVVDGAAKALSPCYCIISYPPLGKGHSLFWTVCRCASSQWRNRSWAAAGSCKMKCAKLSVSKISKKPPAYTIICVRWVRNCSKASAWRVLSANRTPGGVLVNR